MIVKLNLEKQPNGKVIRDARDEDERDGEISNYVVLYIWKV